MSNRTLLFVPVALICFAAISACAPDNTDGIVGRLDGGAGDGSATLGDGGGGGNSDALMECAKETQKATQLPLDIYLMVDTSGSMNGRTGGGASSDPTKWEAVKSAISSFIGDPASAGIGVGLQYFPLIKPGVAASTCSNDAACGAESPCINNKACQQNGPLKFCQSNADCGGANCAPVGACNLINAACFNGGDCLIGGCSLYALSYCSGRDLCAPSDYDAPAVMISPLPAGAAAINTSLMARMPDGLTPTGPALQGAINQASAYATANPGHTVVTVLATDGFPTECSPLEVPAIAAVATAGAAASPSVKTFVIGVFGQSEATTATANLNQIAAAGGTSTAFVIDSSANVATAFLAALNQIRGNAVSCDFVIPQVPGQTIDYSRVNVIFKTDPASSGETFVSVPSAGDCGMTGGKGWYYDDPNVPTKVLLCPETCQSVSNAAEGRVDVVFGCSTVVL